MQTLGVPYPAGYDKIANADLEKQAKAIQANLAKEGIKTSEKKEIIAMIAYLQRLGTDIKGETAESLVGKK
jgi:cytochrome c oxidase cbb3-type subunit I/II